MMPAGTQFDDRASISTKAADALLDTVVEHAGVQVALASTSRAMGYNNFSTMLIRTRTGDHPWKTAIRDDGKRWRTPPGEPSGRGPTPVGIVSGPAGFVATADQQFWDSTLNYRAARAGEIWSSRDGRKWSRFDPRPILGSRVSYLLGVPAVGPDGRFFVTATVGPLDLQGPSKIVVLSSTDGRTWRKAATLDTRWTLDSGQLTATDQGLLLRGYEYACDDTSFFQADFSVAPQTHLWAGDPSGSHWKELDATADGLLVPKDRVPTKASACPSDLNGRNDHYRVAGTLYDQIPGVFVAIPVDGAKVGVSRDGKDWRLADLPGAAVAEGQERGIRTQTVVEQPDGSFVLLSLETRRVDGKPYPGGYQVLAWRTADDGMSWQMLPATRPFELIDGVVQFRPLPDGRVLLTEDENAVKPHTRRLVGTAGPLIPWDSCVPAAGADCRFVTLTGVDVAGIDLSGIDLAGSTITGGDWTGVSLKGGRLVLASIAPPLTGADLTDADASSANFGDHLAGVTLQGTKLSNVTVPLDLLMGGARVAQLGGAYVAVPAEQPAGLDLTGLDLKNVSFGPAGTQPGNLRDVDFGASKLDDASFWHIDLTGAKLGKAKFSRVTFFGPDTICPDGKPAKEGVYDQTACRMKPPK